MYRACYRVAAMLPALLPVDSHVASHLYTGPQPVALQLLFGDFV